MSNERDGTVTWIAETTPPVEVVERAKQEVDSEETPKQAEGELKDRILDRLVDIEINLPRQD